MNLTAPVFPGVDRARGHYESYYLRAVDPASPRAIWIRYTVHKEPGRDPVGSLWCTLFDASQPTPLAVKQTVSDPHGGEWISIAGAHFGPGRAFGGAEALGHLGSWDLTFDAGSGAHEHLPRPWMYSARLPRTKTLSPVCDAHFDGWVEVDDHHVDVSGWRGMVGHNWGEQHAERWIWLHGIAFEDAPDAWIDLAVGRIRLGRWTTPWIANGVLHLDGRRRVLGGLGSIRSTDVDEAPLGATLRLGDVGVVVRDVPEQTVAYAYADPGGGEHHSIHCSVAAVEVEVDGRTLHARHGGCYELGVREHDHGVELLPFPDGDR